MFTCFAVISSKSHFIIAIKLIYNKTQDAVAEKRSYPFTCYMTFYVLNQKLITGHNSGRLQVCVYQSTLKGFACVRIILLVYQTEC